MIIRFCVGILIPTLCCWREKYAKGDITKKSGGAFLVLLSLVIFLLAPRGGYPFGIENKLLSDDSKALRTQVTSLRKIAPSTNPGLTKKLLHLEGSLLEAESSKREGGVLRLDESLLREEIVAIDKMLKFPTVASEFISEIEKAEATMKTWKQSPPEFNLLKNLAAQTKKMLLEGKQIYKAGKLESLHTKVWQLRRDSIPVLKKIEKAMRKMQSSEARKAEAFSRRMRFYIEFSLPHRYGAVLGQPYKEPRPPTSSGPSLNLFICAVRWKAEDPVISQSVVNQLVDEFEIFYNTVSFGQTNFQVHYKIINDLPSDFAPLVDSDDLTLERIQAAAEMCDPEVDFTKLDIFVVPAVFSGANRAIVSAYTGMANLLTDEGLLSPRLGIAALSKLLSTKHLDTNQDVPDPQIAIALSHEVGHLLGFGHASALECGEDPWRGDCLIKEYGNKRDIMGYGKFLYFSGHPSGVIKYGMGWIAAGSIVNDGEYTLGALERDSTLNQVLVLPGYIEFGHAMAQGLVGAAARSDLCIDYRKSLNYDDYEEMGQEYGGRIGNHTSSSPWREIWEGAMNLIVPPESGCLAVYECERIDTRTSSDSRASQVRKISYLLDTLPKSDPLADFERVDELFSPDEQDIFDACLPQGATFNDALLGLSVSFTPSSTDPYAVRVLIDLDEARIGH